MSKDKKSAKKLIDQISTLESAEEVDAILPEGEDRPTVLDAAESRKAELAAEPDQDETTEEETEEAQDESETEDASEVEETAEVIVIGKGVSKAVKAAIEGVIALEKSLRSSNNVARESEGKLIEASKVLKNEPKEVTSEEFKALDKAIVQHLQYDQQRRGMSSPLPQIKALINSYEKLQELEEDEE